MTTEQTGLERWQQARREGTDARLQAALETMRKDKTVPLTQVKLAELAEVSRRTLALPEKAWVADALAAIKQEREVSVPRKPTVDERVANALARVAEAEAQVAATRSHVADLVEENDLLKKEVARLKRELQAVRKSRD